MQTQSAGQSLHKDCFSYMLTFNFLFMHIFPKMILVTPHSHQNFFMLQPKLLVVIKMSPSYVFICFSLIWCFWCLWRVARWVISQNVNKKYLRVSKCLLKCICLLSIPFFLHWLCISHKSVAWKLSFALHILSIKTICTWHWRPKRLTIL